MGTNKAGTYLGFCKRAGKLTLGINAARAVRERVYLLVADRSASENSKKDIAKLSQKLGCPVVWTEGLADLVCKEACKLAAVREEHLAAALQGELGGQE